MTYKTYSDVAIASRYRSALIALRRKLAAYADRGWGTYYVERDIREVTALLEPLVARLAETSPLAATSLAADLYVDNALMVAREVF